MDYYCEYKDQSRDMRKYMCGYEQCFQCKVYQSGKFGSHYPVPAIPMFCEILPLSVFIIEWPKDGTNHCIITYYACAHHDIWN